MFDELSGQVYTETIQKEQPKGKCRVDQITRGSTSSIAGYKNMGSGSAALEQMAIRSVMLNLSGLTPAALEAVPWEVARRVWKQLKSAELDSLNTWRLFAGTYPTEMAVSCQDHKMSIPRPHGLDTHSIIEDFKFITAPNFEWITLLCLSNVTISRTQFIQLSRIHNLGTLAICNNNGRTFLPEVEDSSFDDSVTRAWSRHASESGALSRLRVLVVENCSEITSKSLEYLRVLPALGLCAFGYCRATLRDESHPPVGWRSLDRRTTPEIDRLGALKLSSYQDMNYTLFQSFKVLGGSLIRDDFTCPNAEPVLSVRYGRSDAESLFWRLDVRLLSWFQRTPDLASVATSRPAASDYEQPHVKKRKIRTRKEQDLQDMLGSF